MSDKRQRKQERKRKLEELKYPDRCFCDPPNEETQLAYASAILKCSTGAELAEVNEQYKEMLEIGERVGQRWIDGYPYTDGYYADIWRCKRCGRFIEDHGPAIA